MARITWLADALRAAGLTVVEHAGWQTRERPGDWNPRCGIVHATAAPRSQSDAQQVAIVRDGRSDLLGPIANGCVDRTGVWHVIAAGRCNTTLAGTAGPYRGVGNTGALGVEACNNNNRPGEPPEPWPPVQYQAYVRGWAAIAKRLGWTAANLVGHKEHTPGHKTDPTFDMAVFRRDVSAVLAGGDDEMALELPERSWVRNGSANGGAFALGLDRTEIMDQVTGKISSVDHWGVRTLKSLTAKVDAAAAGDATRAAGMKAAIDALADMVRTGGGDVSTAAILARVDQRAAETRQVVDGLHAQIADLETQVAAYRRAEAEAAQAAADALAD